MAPICVLGVQVSQLVLPPCPCIQILGSQLRLPPQQPLRRCFIAHHCGWLCIYCPRLKMWIGRPRFPYQKENWITCHILVCSIIGRKSHHWKEIQPGSEKGGRKNIQIGRKSFQGNFDRKSKPVEIEHEAMNNMKKSPFVKSTGVKFNQKCLKANSSILNSVK